MRRTNTILICMSLAAAGLVFPAKLQAQSLEVLCVCPDLTELGWMSLPACSSARLTRCGGGLDAAGAGGAPNGGLLDAARVNGLGLVSGSAFYSPRYGSGFYDWYQNYDAFRSGWPEISWFYRPRPALRRSGLVETAVNTLRKILIGKKQAPPTDEQISRNFKRAWVNPEELKKSDPVMGTIPGSVPAPGNQNVSLNCSAKPGASIPPVYGMFFNSLHGGQAESSAMKVERFPDGRAVYTDSSNTRWTYRPYGALGEKGDFYYRPPLGASDRLVYGDIKNGRGYRVETAAGDIIEFSAMPDGTAWRPGRLNAADGSWLTYSYGPNGLARITDMHGRYFSFERNSQGWPVSITDEQGRKTAFAYDAAGHATQVTSPDGSRKSFAYDAGGMISSVKNGSLAEERYSYDASGRVLTSESEGGVSRLEHYYNDAASKTVITDALGNRTEYSYVNENGSKLTTGVTDALGGKVALAYDANFNIAETADQLGRTTKFVRNANGDPETIVDALGSTSTIQYQAKMSYADESGEHTDYYSRPVRITDALGRVTSLGYDGFGNLSRTEDALGNKTSMKYDKAGHMLELRDALGAAYKYEYTMGLTKSVDPLGRTVRYKRDADLHVTRLTDPLGRNTTFTYDLSGNVTSVTNPQGFVTKFTYDNGACPSCGGSQLSALTDPKGNVWTFNYDQYGRLADTANPMGQKKAYQYDKMSRVTEVKDPAGNITAYAYDALNRLTKKDIQTPAGERSVTDHTYDAVGNLLSASNASSSVSFVYDALNRAVETTQTFAGKSYTISYTFDAVGNRTSMTTPWGKYAYTYDALNRQTGIVNPQGINVSFGYDAVGRRTSKKIFKTTPELLAETSYSYDTAGQLLNITNKAGGKVVAFANYQYNAAGNRVKKEDRDGTTQYRYDASNRLITAEPVPMKMEEAEVFIYDRNGNRRYDKGAWDYKYDPANRLLENSTYTYTHDLNGNLTGRTDKRDNSAITYIYNPEQQLSEVTTPEHKIQCKYDTLGRRIEKSVDGSIQRYVYDNEDIVAILDVNAGPIETFTHGPGIDEPLIMTKADGKNYYYHADGLGSIVALTNEQNQVIETYGYKAYGQPTVKDHTGAVFDKSTVGNPYFFTARELDSESRLYFLRNRYYDWGRGAFTQEDVISFKGRDSNLYRYVANRPTNYTDPYGTVIPLAVYPILVYTLWDAALNSTYVETKEGGVLTVPPPILWSTALPGLWGAQVAFKTKKYMGVLFNLPVEMSFLVPKYPICATELQGI